MSALSHTETLGGVPSKMAFVVCASAKRPILQKVKKTDTNIYCTVDKLCHLIFIITPICMHNYPHFLDEDTESQRGKIILPRLLMPAGAQYKTPDTGLSEHSFSCTKN